MNAHNIKGNDKPKNYKNYVSVYMHELFKVMKKLVGKTRQTLSNQMRARKHKSKNSQLYKWEKYEFYNMNF